MSQDQGIKQKKRTKFGFLQGNAFEYGAPPHGGLELLLENLDNWLSINISRWLNEILEIIVYIKIIAGDERIDALNLKEMMSRLK